MADKLGAIVKGAAHFPYPKLRDVLTAQPGWYHQRHGCDVKHSSEILADKIRRSRRAIQTEAYGGSLMEGHEDEFLIYLGPELPDMPWEQQREQYHDAYRKQAVNTSREATCKLAQLSVEYFQLPDDLSAQPIIAAIAKKIENGEPLSWDERHRLIEYRQDRARCINANMKMGRSGTVRPPYR